MLGRAFVGGRAEDKFVKVGNEMATRFGYL
jgi:hypothetical protein